MDDGIAVQVTQNGAFVGLESFDGKWFYFSKLSEPGIWKIPVDGGDEVKILDDDIHKRNWVLAVDGIYYMRELDSSFRIEYRNWQSEQITVLAEIDGECGHYLDVSPDRSWLLFTKIEQAESDIMMIENFQW